MQYRLKPYYNLVANSENNININICIGFAKLVIKISILNNFGSKPWVKWEN